MNPLQKAVAFFLIGGILLGAGVGSFLGFRMGVQEGLAADLSAREILASEVTALQTINTQQQISIQTSEASISQLTRNIENQQRAHEYENQELELYRRIESGGLDRGIHVDEVQLVEVSEGLVLRVTLMQVGSREDVQGELGVALIGAELPGATDGRLVLAGGFDGLDGSGNSANSANPAVEFDFRFLSRIAVPLPDTLPKDGDSGETFAWVKGLDMIEVYITPNDSRRMPKRVTIPADQMIVGPAE